MNGNEINAELRGQAHRALVAHIDLIAVRAALLGTPVALEEIEQGVTVTLCDLLELDQETVAEGLGIHPRSLQRRIKERRTQILEPHYRAIITDAVREPVDALIQAVEQGDGPILAEILKGYDRMRMVALVLELASRAAAPVPQAGAADAL